MASFKQNFFQTQQLLDCLKPSIPCKPTAIYVVLSTMANQTNANHAALYHAKQTPCALICSYFVP